MDRSIRMKVAAGRTLVLSAVELEQQLGVAERRYAEARTSATMRATSCVP
jgi:hypothetical protein